MCKLLSMHAWNCKKKKNANAVVLLGRGGHLKQQTEGGRTPSAPVCTSDYPSEDENILGNWSAQSSSMKNKASDRVWDLSGELDTERFTLKEKKKTEKSHICRWAQKLGGRDGKANCPTKVDMHLGVELKLPELLYIFLGMENRLSFLLFCVAP